MTPPELPTNHDAAVTLDEVVERMVVLEAALPVGDGVGYFNKLYLEVTRAIVRRLRGGEFEQPRFLEHLAVLVNAYFRALDDFERDPRRGLPRLGSALGGSCPQARGADPVRPRRNERPHQLRPSDRSRPDV
jgi:hypothetical protein